MSRFALLLALLLVCLAPFSAAFAQSQEVTSLAAVEVDLWPEFDQPSVLVIYHLTLPPNTSLPADLRIRIPKDARINAVASRQPDGSLVNLTYDSTPAGEWVSLSFKATTLEGQLEYYDARLEKDGAQRRYSYRWPADMAVENLSVQVQQPAGATQMQISPSLGNGVAGSDGMMYFTAGVGSVPAGQDFTLTFQYNKANDDLSMSNLPVEPSAPIDTGVSILTQLRDMFPYLLTGLGVLLIIGGGFWFWQSGRSREPVASRNRRRPPRSAASRASQASPVDDTGQIYCHNCGKRASAGDRFCRTCGTPLRSS